MKTFWRVLETLAVVTLVLVWPLGAFAQIGKITSPGGYGTSPTFVGTVTFGSTTTAGTATTLINDTITGSSTTSNFLNITGTFNNTLSATTSGVYVSITGSDEASNQRSLYSLFTASGVAAIGQSAGVYGEFAGTAVNNLGVGVHGKSTGAVSSISYPTYGVLGDNVNNTGSKTFIGVGGFGNSLNGASGNNIGGFFAGSAQVTTAALSAGVIGLSRDATISAGGYFGFTATSFSDPGGGSVVTNGLFTGKAALIADNQSIAANIFEARDNGAATSTTAASANVTILDGAQMRLGNQVLTSATMTPTIVGEARTVTHSYAWTNAMVTALGAALTGDITVATLPAKTQINNAYVVIDGAAAGPATVTVSCGDAIAGTPFINYIVASDAKAAANTVYGDAAAERGTSIDVEFYYLPSYTATTLVTCHFISTGANLNTVTGSSGRLILTTTLLP